VRQELHEYFIFLKDAFSAKNFSNEYFDGLDLLWITIEATLDTI
jgi:hypothetical protein